jgi:hypothetical protein
MENHIEIKIFRRIKIIGDDGVEKYEEFTREISYRGTYTVWWSPPE